MVVHACFCMHPFLKCVGGLMRPGSNMAAPGSELVKLPGFSRDIPTSRTKARRRLAQSGVRDLEATLLARSIPMPHFVGADLLAESWAAIGVTIVEGRRPIFDWQKVIDPRDFDVVQDFAGDFYGDPTIPLTRAADEIRLAGSAAHQLLGLGRPLPRCALHRRGGDHRSARARAWSASSSHRQSSRGGASRPAISLTRI
jgi:hypothetical protein